MTKTYAVTGVASGIGAELARILTAQGHRVIGFDLVEVSRNVDRFIPLNLDDPASITAACDALDEPLDGLCNNAGVPPRPGMETHVLQINFLGQRQFLAGVLSHLNEGASVVNMASRAGQFWRDNLDQVKRLADVSDRAGLDTFIAAETIDATRCYNLSKEAMIVWSMALTEQLLRRGVRVNSLSPAAVSTGILDDFKRAFGDKVTANIARAGRAGKPEEIAQIAAFLLSPASGWLKGIDVHADGGMAAFAQSDMLELGALKLPD